MPFYNSREFLFDSIACQLSMLQPSDELVLVNDGSTDLLNSDFARIRGVDSRVNLINLEHVGLISALNIGISECQYELIARSDIDDEYNPARIQIQRSYLGSNPNFAAVFSDYVFISRSSKSLGVMPTAIGPTLTKLSILNPQRLAHPSAMFRKSAVLDAGGYSTDAKFVEDLALWIQLNRRFQLGTVPERLLRYRLNPDGVSLNNRHVMKSQAIKFLGLHFEYFRREINFESVLDEILDYQNHESAGSRTILALRDLLTFEEMSGFSHKKSMFHVFKNLPRNIVSALPTNIGKLASEKILRKIYRMWA